MAREFKNLEYADELYKIQLKWTEGDTEPLNSDDIDDLIKVLKEQLEIINGEDEDFIEVDNKQIDVCTFETIYNYYLQNTVDNVKYMAYQKDDEYLKKARIMNFLNDIQEQRIIVKIFDNKRDLLNYIFIDGRDTEQLLDSIESLAMNGFDIEKQNNILKIDNLYVYYIY